MKYNEVTLCVIPQGPQGVAGKIGRDGSPGLKGEKVSMNTVILFFHLGFQKF